MRRSHKLRNHTSHFLCLVVGIWLPRGNRNKRRQLTETARMQPYQGIASNIREPRAKAVLSVLVGGKQRQPEDNVQHIPARQISYMLVLFWWRDGRPRLDTLRALSLQFGSTRLRLRFQMFTVSLKYVHTSTSVKYHRICPAFATGVTEAQQRSDTLAKI